VRLRVRLFALARQSAGCDSVEVELPPGTTIAGLRSQLAAQLPESSAFLSHCLFAVDAQYAGDNCVLSPGADVACIPPVSGG
jgi:molybdopterin converting factor small subunit